MICIQTPLILASASPRRKMLLSSLGLPFRTVTSNVDESGVEGDPAKITLLLAEKKAVNVFSRTSPSWVLGADTVVIIDEKRLGKPGGKDKAFQMLSLLSGRKHTVITGFCIIEPSGRVVHAEAVSTKVLIKELSKHEIENYVKTGEPFDKAGSYAIQGLGCFMVKSISGSYTNVVGLPVAEVIKALIATGGLSCFPLVS
jgi:septum formation protein